MKKGKKTINDFPNYEIDTEGNVYSKKRQIILKPICCNGYMRVNLCKNGERSCKRISRLVLEVFVGKCPDRKEACHDNGNKTDNRLSNLRWDTKSNNAKDSIKHGTAVCVRVGENSANHKLTEQDVRMIIYMYRTGLYTQQEIGNVYGVGQMAISSIITGKTWKHIWEKGQ